MGKPVTGLSMRDYEHLRELLPAYSIGATDADETRMVEAGLVEFPELADELREFQAVSDALADAVPAMTPPPALLGSLLAAAREVRPTPAPSVKPVASVPQVLPKPTQKPRLTVSWRLVAASLALFLVATNAFWLYRATQPAVREIKLWDSTDGATNPLRCRIVLFPNNPSAVMIAQNFPTLEAGRTYQMWLRDENGVAFSLGVFEVDETGNGILTFPADTLSQPFESIGVTIEPEGGSPEPTTPSVVRWRSI